MNNREKFIAVSDGELREVLARVFDKATLFEKTGRAMFTDFLSEREMSEVISRKKNIDETPFTAYGGYPQAGRLMLRFSDGEEEFPIKAVVCTGKGIEKLKHPDFLGSITALGIDRKNVGDIVPDGERVVVFAESRIADFIAENLLSVGNVSVRCVTDTPMSVAVEPHFETISGTVASLRADSVVSVMLKTSRSTASEYIQAQKFFLNQQLCTKCDKEIKENDIITVRHHGKARVTDVNGRSKKGRIFITLQKYS